MKENLERVLKLYRILNVLSIDVALGAICSSAWLANYFQVQLRVYAYLALGITVWIIYTADHLLDAKRIMHKAASVRHQFHQKNFKQLTLLTGIAIVVDGVLVFFVRDVILYSGLMLSLVIIVYLLFNRWLSYVKEFFVAVLYCGGVLLPILSVGGLQLLSQHVIIVFSFFLTVLINIVLFSWFDLEKDKQDNQRSLVVMLGDRPTRRFIYLLFLLQLVMGGYAIISVPLTISILVLFLMNLVLAIIFLNWKWFSINDKFRLAGDAIFLIPLTSILFV